VGVGEVSLLGGGIWGGEASPLGGEIWGGEASPRFSLLRELVKLRASQINGCAYCVDMHSLDARAGGEAEQRLYALPVWHETPFFTERERAALLWTEKLTLLSIDHVPDEVFEQVRQHFSEEELANLTLVIATINAWNRFGVSFRDVPGEYTPRKH
jgi:AhpD family alkylhydroperoxidase